MNKKSGFLIFASIFCVALLFIINRVPIQEVSPTGDSGFDSSYDGGGSSSSSDWGSSSSSSSGGGGTVADNDEIIFEKYFGDGFTFKNYIEFFKSKEHLGMFLQEMFLHGFIFIFIYLFIFKNKKKAWIYFGITSGILFFFPFVYLFIAEFLISMILMFKTGNKGGISNVSYNEIDLTPYGIDPNSIHQEIYDIYVRIQEAWMNFTLEDVRDCLSDEMYNQYIVQLDTLKVKNQRNVMSDFVYLNCAVTCAYKLDNILVIEARLKVQCRDYIIDDNTKQVLRGDKNKINTYDYHLVFEKGRGEVITNCPNCGGELDPNGQSITCPYCNSNIVRKSGNLVLRKKRMLKQQ